MTELDILEPFRDPKYGVTKAILTFLGYGVLGPLLGYLIHRAQTADRWIVGIMIVLTGVHPTHFTFMVDSISGYRGHTKGFELSIIDMLAVALLTASMLRFFRGRYKEFRLWPPGATLWSLFCAFSSLSLVTVLSEPLYTPELWAMAFWKFSKMLLIYIAIFNFVRSKEDVQAMLNALVAILLVQALVCLKLRYFDYQHQVYGWFEHQNSLAPWAYLCGLPLLAVSMSRGCKIGNSLFYFSGYCAAMVCIVYSVSRASLVIAGGGTLIILFVGLFTGFSKRRSAVIIGVTIMVIIAFIGAWDTIAKRFDEGFNPETKDGKPITHSRVMYNQQSAAMLDDHPLGVGWNNYGIANSYPANYNDIAIEWAAERKHNSTNMDLFQRNPLTENLYWLLLAETGYPGLIGFIIFAGTTMGWISVSISRYRTSFLAFFLFGLLVVLGIHYFHSYWERVLTQTKNISIWMILVASGMKLSYLCRLSDRINLRKEAEIPRKNKVVPLRKTSKKLPQHD